MCVITENKQLQFLSIVTTVYFFCLYFSPSSVPVSSFGIDFTDRIVSPTLVVNQQSANLLKTHKKKNTADMHLSAIGGTVLGYIALLLKIYEDLWRFRFC